MLGLKRPRVKPVWTPPNPDTAKFDVEQSGNTLRIYSEDFHAQFVVSGIDLPADADGNFAVWHLLPFAMRRGFDLRINRPLDPFVIANAERFSRVWEMWAPELFQAVRVSGRGTWRRPPRKRKPAISLYSGGVDSTFMLTNRGRLKERGNVLTVHGADYGPKDRTGFSTLIARTDQLLESLNYDRITIWSDNRAQSWVITYGCGLASSVFLLSDLFEIGIIGADYTPEQDMAVVPMGSNHITNPLLAGSDFSLQTDCTEVLRSQKVKHLAGNPTALQALSFCIDKSVHPDNCGVCRKCVRTKAMFLASTGACPDIFRDQTLTADHLRSVDLTIRSEFACFCDLYNCAVDNGTLHLVPGLEQRRVEHLAAVRT